MHYAVPRILAHAGLLERFFTDSYIGNKPRFASTLRMIQRLGGGNLAKRWLGRNDPALPPSKVTSFEGLGLRYAIARRQAKGTTAMNAVYAATGARFAGAIIRHGLGDADTIWGYNTASVEIFRNAKTKGLHCVLEQTILPKLLERRLLRETAADWPGWQPGYNTLDDNTLLADREAEEWALADLIVAGSDFVAQGLAECGVDRSKIRVVPYGVDAGRFSPTPERSSAGRPLRVLFVGEVGLRKGVPYLLEALNMLDRGMVDARLAGTVVLAPDRLARYEERAQILGAVPRSEIPKLFHWADVFVLPSVVEGSATVTYEALMSGIPVITTANSGSIVRDGESGRIVAVRNATAIAEAIAEYAEDRTLLERHRKGALAARTEADVQRYARDLLRLFGSNAS
jgi:glycosyltransferase involved in cell wall biosynthesis